MVTCSPRPQGGSSGYCASPRQRGRLPLSGEKCCRGAVLAAHCPPSLGTPPGHPAVLSPSLPTSEVAVAAP